MPSVSCLLVQQPYASLIVFGRKRWEFRSYEAKRRGCIGIAASPSSVLMTKDFALNKISGMFPRGVVIGTANLVNCFYVTRNDLLKQDHTTVRLTIHGNEITTLDAPIGEPERDVTEAAESSSWGSFAWELENIKPLNAPIPFVKQSRSTWFSVELPDGD